MKRLAKKINFENHELPENHKKTFLPIAYKLSANIIWAMEGSLEKALYMYV